MQNSCGWAAQWLFDAALPLRHQVVVCRLGVSKGYICQVAQSPVHLAFHRVVQCSKSTTTALQYGTAAGGLHCSGACTATVTYYRIGGLQCVLLYTAVQLAVALPRNNCTLCPWHNGICLQPWDGQHRFSDVPCWYSWPCVCCLAGSDRTKDKRLCDVTFLRGLSWDPGCCSWLACVLLTQCARMS